MTETKREPVNYLYSSLNWNFIKGLAEIARYAEDKYGSAEQYRHTRLTGEKAPLNHVLEHYRSYLAGEPHDRFGDPVYHLYAMAYNVMIEFYYHTNFGHAPSLLTGEQFHPVNPGEETVAAGELDAHAETQLTTAELDNASELIADPTNDLAGPEQGFLERFLTMVGGNRK